VRSASFPDWDCGRVAIVTRMTEKTEGDNAHAHIKL
jgi:hypothetical protein